MQRIHYFYRVAGFELIRWTATTLALWACLCARPTLGAAVTRTWDGGAAGADANWASATNWSGNVAPVSGDNLTFSGGVKLVNTNNFPNNTDFGIISISGDFTLRGNTVDLTNAVEATAGANGVLDLDFRLTKAATFYGTLGGFLQHEGTINLNGFNVTFDGEGGGHQIDGLITDTTTISHVTIDGGSSGPPLNLSGNTVTLNGTNNIPNGMLVTNLGSLVLNGSCTGLVVVASTASVSGSGRLGPLTCAGTVSPSSANSSGARLRIGGPCTFTSTATISVFLGGTTAGTTYDQLQCSNTVTLGSSHLAISRASDFIPSIGNQFTILEKTAAGAITGTFSGLAEGANITNNGVAYSVSYVGGPSGNDVVLTVTNLSSFLVDRSWDGGGGPSVWSNSTNWNSNIALVASNRVLFSRSSSDAICTNDLAADTVFTHLRFFGSSNTNNYPLLRGNSIRLLGGIIATNIHGSGGAVEVDLPIKLAASQTFTNSSPTNTISLGSNILVHPFTLTVRGPGTFRSRGAITATNNANLLVVNGGNLIVDGSVTGNVSVINSGDLAVNGSVSGSVSVTNSSLSGTGRLGALTIVGSSLSPGDDGPGLLTVNGALSLNAASTANFELNSGTPGSGYDQIVVSNGNLSLGSSTLNLLVAPDVADVVGFTYTLFSLPNPANTLTGQFAGIADGVELDVAPLRFMTDYSGGSGNEFSLTIIGAVPSGQLQFNNMDAANQGDRVVMQAHVNASRGFTNLHAAGYTFDNLILTDDPTANGGQSLIVVKGNLIRLESGIVISNLNSGDRLDVEFTAPLALNNDMTFAANADGTMTLSDVNLDNHALTIDGFNSFAGPRGISITGLVSGATSSSKIIKNTAYDLTIQPFGGVCTYQGSTLVTTGRLAVTGTIASTAIMMPGTTLNATGSIGGILATSAVVVPGTLVSTGAVVFDAGSELKMALPFVPGGGGGTSFTCNSGLNLGGAKLTFTMTFRPLGDTNYTLISKTSAGPITGTFGGLPQNTDFIYNGRHYRIIYNGGDGNDVVIFTTNNVPVIAQLPDTTIFEQVPYTQQVIATDADPVDTNSLAYALDPISPTNAVINPATGLISWTPTEDQGPGSYTFTVWVADLGAPPKSNSMTFHVSVLDSNLPPLITAPSTVTSNELTQITIAVNATDPDTPSDNLVYELLQGPVGMSISSTSSTNATLTWTPDETQGPSTNNVVFRVREVTSGLTTTQAITVVAREINVPPVMQPVAGTNMLSGRLLQRLLSASDTDFPANPLTFQLITPPAGASIVTNGLFQWTPASNQIGSFAIKIRCFDTNPPAFNSKSLSVTQQFTVTVGILRVVINTNDSGPGSLREAILEVNTNNSGGQIQFAIPGTGPFKIAPLTALPGLAHATVIDGYTQTNSLPNTLTIGDNAQLMIEISGENIPSSSGLSWGGFGGGQPVTIRGLCINRFTNGVALNSGCASCGGAATAGSVIEGCFIGTDVTGSTAFPNGVGIQFSQTHDSAIGGPDISQRNLISGNLTDAIYPTEGFDGHFVFNLTIQNNLIGCDHTGTNALGNGDLGIAAPTGGAGGFGFSDHGCLIADNVFAANAHGGLQFGGTSNVFVRNKIGVGADGLTPLGNHGIGMDLFGNGQIVGGEASDGNIIANNNGAGVHISDGVGHWIVGNSLFGNFGIGIDLGSAGVTDNDAGDTDIGPNNLQNFPVLTSVVTTPTTTIVSGTLNSISNVLVQTYRIELFHSPDFAPAGQRQGKFFLGFVYVTANVAGNASFSFTMNQLFSSGIFTATATDSNGNTSEFSAGLPFAVLNISPGSSQMRLTWLTNLTGSVLQSNANLANPNGWFDVPGSPGATNTSFFRDFPRTESPRFFRLRLP